MGGFGKEGGVSKGDGGDGGEESCQTHKTNPQLVAPLDPSYSYAWGQPGCL